MLQRSLLLGYCIAVFIRQADKCGTSAIRKLHLRPCATSEASAGSCYVLAKLTACSRISLY